MIDTINFCKEHLDAVEVQNYYNKVFVHSTYTSMKYLGMTLIVFETGFLEARYKFQEEGKPSGEGSVKFTHEAFTIIEPSYVIEILEDLMRQVREALDNYKEPQPLPTNALVPINPMLSRDPDDDFNFLYKGFGIHKSECNVKIWKFPAGGGFVLLTDTGKGTSVTNASETIITDLYALKFAGVPKKDLFFAEMYTERPIENMDAIVPKWVGDKCVGVDWLPLAQIFNPKKP